MFKPFLQYVAQIKQGANMLRVKPLVLFGQHIEGKV
jgi:hypothetical protein